MMVKHRNIWKSKYCHVILVNMSSFIVIIVIIYCSLWPEQDIYYFPDAP